MSIKKYNRSTGEIETSYTGCVLANKEHFWSDGMLEVKTIYWNGSDVKEMQTGYYGIDGCNLCNIDTDIDCSVETAIAVIDWIRTKAEVDYKIFVDNRKKEICPGRNVVVSRGRKIPKGTKLEVFWCGDKPTYRSTQHTWMNETEKIAGCYDINHNKIWIKADYLDVLDIIPDPTEEEKSMWIENYIRTYANSNGYGYIVKLSVDKNNS